MLERISHPSVMYDFLLDMMFFFFFFLFLLKSARKKELERKEKTYLMRSGIQENS